MGKRIKKTPARKRKMAKREKPRKLTKSGKIRRKRGDLRVVNSMEVGFQVKQGKHGKWVRSNGERVCKIHTVCDCVKRSDPSSLSRVFNR